MNLEKYILDIKVGVSIIRRFFVTKYNFMYVHRINFLLLMKCKNSATLIKNKHFLGKCIDV